MKNCIICDDRFKPEKKNSITCGEYDCVKANENRNRVKNTGSKPDQDVIMKNRFLTNSWY
jgi:hypothetical protein